MHCLPGHCAADDVVKVHEVTPVVPQEVDD